MSEDPPTPHAPIDLTGLVLSTDTLQDFVEALAGQALTGTSSAYGCGITLERQGRPLTVASAGSSALQLDEKQYGLDDGPCLQALRQHEEVLVTDMLGEQRWGPYPADALAYGVRSSFSLPIAARTGTVAALNAYSPLPNGFTDGDKKVLRDVAAQATGAVALAQRLADAEEFARDLQAALRFRTLIDQAVGVIMGQRRCDADQAFGVLRQASQNRNIKLRDLAVELLTDIGGHPPRGPDIMPRP